MHGNLPWFSEVPGVPSVPGGTEGLCAHRDLTENPLTALPDGSFLGFVHLQSL